jgi:hypothetical protein
MKEEIFREAVERVPELSMLELYLIVGLVVMVTLAGALGLYVKSLHKNSVKQQDAQSDKMMNLTEKVTTAMVNNTHAIENNNRLIDKLFDKMDNFLR